MARLAVVGNTAGKAIKNASGSTRRRDAPPALRKAGQDPAGDTIHALPARPTLRFLRWRKISGESRISRSRETQDPMLRSRIG